MSPILQPGHQRVDLSNAQIRRLFRTQVKQINAFQRQRVVRKQGRLQSCRHVFGIRLFIGCFGKDGYSPDGPSQAGHQRQMISDHLDIRGALFSPDVAAPIHQTRIPQPGAGKHGNDDAFARLGGQVDGKAPNLAAAPFAGGDLNLRIERGAVIMQLACDRKPTVLRQNLIVTHEHIELQIGARRRTRQKKRRHNPAQKAAA